MYAEKQSIRCDSCGKGQIVKHFEDISFRQWTDRGHIHCRTAVVVSVCEGCGAGSPERGAQKIVDEGSRRDHDKHIAHWRSVICQV
jgi:hypothetical protein